MSTIYFSAVSLSTVSTALSRRPISSCGKKQTDQLLSGSSRWNAHEERKFGRTQDPCISLEMSSSSTRTFSFLSSCLLVNWCSGTRNTCLSEMWLLVALLFVASSTYHCRVTSAGTTVEEIPILCCIIQTHEKHALRR